MRRRPAPATSARLRATVILTACLAATHYLRGLGHEPWARIGVDQPLLWLTGTPAEDVVAALLRVAALAACWWVLATFLALSLVHAVGWRPAIRVVDRLAPGFVRGLARQLTGGALLAASLLGPASPAVATGTGPDPAAPVDRFAPPGATTHQPAGIATSPSPEPPRPAPERPAAPSGERRVRVEPGDHLWGIARTEVARRRGVRPQGVAGDDVAAYWRRVVEANVARLRSGDADLLFPGEDVILPGD